MNHTAAFIMPVKISGSEMELRHLQEAIGSIENQTDKDWMIIISEDFSNDDRVYAALEEYKERLGDKIHIIYAKENHGAGVTRNIGIRYAASIGIPFILFLDADDLADPRRLELVRKAFEDPSVNVAYTSFDIIDENGDRVPDEEIALPIKEIIDGHKVDIVEGEKAWIAIATKKKYTNLTSCTAVRTSLALEEPFPPLSASEDCHTWMRYGAHPGKFFFIRDIIGHYRIRRGVVSRSRANMSDFYDRMYQADADGFESALKVAKKLGTLGDIDENDLRARFHVRLALNLLFSGRDEYCKKSLLLAKSIVGDKYLEYVDGLPCDFSTKSRMKSML